ncbi:hypothetical protein NW768_010922 [Fusarium equiseti]|uniref:Modin n=1 Tax=Fusarium equiseti TaxID=61235 RepID=A0ABQ8QZ60_FUSEQ|nr:hypothetical protein NW768_010922 [Fusarium equiseti]
MATKAKIECSLNTTECILETIASILGEIQEQNDEYNWDPLTFVFTAIIGVIAIVFAALTAFQAFLAAGPGRTKSGAYAIGPWSRLNRRKFDLAEMRFRTTSFTPILTVHSLNSCLFEGELSDFVYQQEPAKYRKGQDDYFPGTWLALLSCLSLDNTKFWVETKLTGADFIPSELSAVPAYGSIRFVACLAMILSRGRSRLTIDQESGLPRVRCRSFNLMFRQHPVLGAIGFFEMYDISLVRAMRHIKLYRRLIQAYGCMSISELRQHCTIGLAIGITQTGTIDSFEGYDYMRSFAVEVQLQCPHGKQAPKPACYNVLKYLKGHYPEILMNRHSHLFNNGPLHLLIAPMPDAHPLPSFFPHKKAKLRERLDTLLLQSRFWGTKPMAHRDLSSIPLAEDAHIRRQVTDTAVSWAKSNIKPDIEDLVLAEGAYKLCSAYLEQTLTQKPEYDDDTKNQQRTLQQELMTIDQWLKQMENYALCIIVTLSVIGDGIQQMIDSYQPSKVETIFKDKIATLPPSLDGLILPALNSKLVNFIEALGKPDSFSCLFPDITSQQVSSEKDLDEVRYDTFQGLRTIQRLWKMEELPVDGENTASEDRADRGQVHKTSEYAWKFPTALSHPLDDILIYRAVLLTLIYCLSNDSSDLMDGDGYETIVPIM